MPFSSVLRRMHPIESPLKLRLVHCAPNGREGAHTYLRPIQIRLVKLRRFDILVLDISVSRAR